jgi:hypothetical protein
MVGSDISREPIRNNHGVLGISSGEPRATIGVDPVVIEGLRVGSRLRPPH